MSENDDLTSDLNKRSPSPGGQASPDGCFVIMASVAVIVYASQLIVSAIFLPHISHHILEKFSFISWLFYGFPEIIVIAFLTAAISLVYSYVQSKRKRSLIKRFKLSVHHGAINGILGVVKYTFVALVILIILSGFLAFAFYGGDRLGSIIRGQTQYSLNEYFNYFINKLITVPASSVIHMIGFSVPQISHYPSGMNVSFPLLGVVLNFFGSSILYVCIFLIIYIQLLRRPWRYMRTQLHRWARLRR